MSGGEVLEKPSLFTRIGDKIYGVNKKKPEMKGELYEYHY